MKTESIISQKVKNTSVAKTRLDITTDHIKRAKIPESYIGDD
jgi:hypothetical protein